MNACDGIINQLASWQSFFCQGGSFRKLHGMCVTATLRQSSSDSGLDEIMAQRKRLVNYPFAGGWRYGILGG